MWQKRHNGYFEVKVFRPCLRHVQCVRIFKRIARTFLSTQRTQRQRQAEEQVSRKRAVPSRAEDASDTESPRRTRTYAAPHPRGTRGATRTQF